MQNSALWLMVLCDKFQFGKCKHVNCRNSYKQTSQYTFTYAYKETCLRTIICPGFITLILWLQQMA